ncbi:hypothetical protein [Saccharothrix lopnurensis]|uniref:Uncharacterized protein n=1 Tax=Saccharothrix lopnurensis TaxID=1670621 RepID=A0ABW1PED7_9PSEU
MTEGPLTPSVDDSLVPLLMQTGTVASLLGNAAGWQKLAGALKQEFGDFAPGPDGPRYVNLCTIYYQPRSRAVVTDLEGDRLIELVAGAIAFLEMFMDHNGQWPYLRRQSWFADGDHVIAVDVNYYPDRSEYKAVPSFHKDSAGNNVFVNLIFDNQEPVEATEWFADVEEPSAKRREWQEKLLPPAHLAALDHARAVLKAGPEANAPVRGGISHGEHTYLSWVDDLVWHATPVAAKRVEYGAADALRAHQGLDAAPEGAFYWYDHQLGVYVFGIELLGTMAEGPGPHLRGWLADRGLKAQDLDVRTAHTAWRELYRGADGAQRLGEDAAERERTDWRVNGQYSVANAYDGRLAGSDQIEETPIGLSGRRRANSVEELAAVQAVAAANQGKPRSFIRTWVRVLPKDSEEIRKADVVF